MLARLRAVGLDHAAEGGVGRCSATVSDGWARSRSVGSLESSIDRRAIWAPETGSAYLVTKDAWRRAATENSVPLYIGGISARSRTSRGRAPLMEEASPAVRHDLDRDFAARLLGSEDTHDHCARPSEPNSLGAFRLGQ